MRIFNTKRAVALVVAFTALMMEACLLPLSAGPKPQSALQVKAQGETQELAAEAGIAVRHIPFYARSRSLVRVEGVAKIRGEPLK